jgi:fatty-acyl-CoA synthase
VPVRIFALDAFPTTTSANGTKVQRAKLREMAQARLKA